MAPSPQTQPSASEPSQQVSKWKVITTTYHHDHHQKRNNLPITTMYETLEEKEITTIMGYP
jgi:hypothetical protein